MTPIGKRWGRARASAPDWSPPPVHTLVVAPHPDDEILMFGGLIAHQVEAGLTVDVLAVTDGEAAYPAKPRHQLAEIRRREQHDALRTISGADLRLVRLGVPDGAAASFDTTIRDAIVDLSQPGGLIAAPWHLDYHCDHETIGRLALTVSRRAKLRLAQGLFWGWHHRSEDDLAQPLRRLRLSPGTTDRRSRALACHRSQVDPGDDTSVLDAASLEPMTWTFEYHLVSWADAAD